MNTKMMSYRQSIDYIRNVLAEDESLMKAIKTKTDMWLAISWQDTSYDWKKRTLFCLEPCGITVIKHCLRMVD